MATNFLVKKFYLPEIAAFVLFLAFLAWICFASEKSNWFRSIDNQVRAYLISSTSDADWLPRHSALVAYDNETLRSSGFPLPRSRYAEALKLLKPLEPRVLVFDILFGENSDYLGTKKFAEELKSQTPVVLAAIFSSEWIPPLEIWQRESPGLFKVDSNQVGIPLESSWPPILSRSDGIAISESQVDDDGILRWYSLVHPFGSGWVPSLGLASALRYLNADFKVVMDENGVSKIIIFNNEGEFTVDLSLDPKLQGRLLLIPKLKSAVFPEFSLQTLLDRKADDKAFQKKALFFAATADGVKSSQSTVLDSVQTPIHNHIFIFEDIVSHNFIKPFQHSKTLSFSISVIFLSTALALSPMGLFGIFIFSTAVLAFVFLSGVLIWSQNYFPHLVGPVFSVLGFASVQLLRRFSSDQRSKRNLQRSFSQYLHPSLVEKIGDTDEVLVLGGAERELTIYFCDLRNFTQLSEYLKPQELVRLMNQYFEVVTEEIQRTGGTVDKYIGDAVMAFWNAPLSIPDHSQRAYQACLEIERKFSELKIHWEGRLGRHSLEMGMAIHSGKAIVGNVGSTKRFNYTAIGDDVNLTSRLEGLTKYYSVSTIVSGSVRAALSHSELVLLDWVRVKGKTTAVELYVILPEEFRACKEQWLQFLKAYQAGQWELSLSLLSSLEHLPWCDVFELRIHQLMNSAQSWDGIWSFITK